MSFSHIKWEELKTLVYVPNHDQNQKKKKKKLKTKHNTEPKTSE